MKIKSLFFLPLFISFLGSCEKEDIEPVEEIAQTQALHFEVKEDLLQINYEEGLYMVFGRL